jgi:hypothetical protein
MKRSIARRSVEVEVEDIQVVAAVVSSVSSEFELDSSATLEDLVYMLHVVVGVMLMGYFVIGVNWLTHRRRVSAVEAGCAIQ